MPLYELHGTAVEIQSGGQGLERLLADLSFEPCCENTAADLRVSISSGPIDIPPSAREVFREGPLTGWQAEDVHYLSDGSSRLQIEHRLKQMRAWLVPGFGDRPHLQQQRLWIAGLVKLLQSERFFALHAAGLVSSSGEGLLIVGASGSGKSTLAAGLVLSGWRYLGDDTLLLRPSDGGVEALAFRKPFSLDSATCLRFPQLGQCRAWSSHEAEGKRRLDMDRLFADRHQSSCVPTTILFPRILGRTESALKPGNVVDVLGKLLEQSSPQLFDRATMESYLVLLRQLIAQSQSFGLKTGWDLYHDASILQRLLDRTTVSGECLAPS